MQALQPVRIAPADTRDSEVAELLYYAIGGDRSRLTAAVLRYRDDPASRLLAATVGEELAAVAGYAIHHDRITLLHIATAESHRRHNLGRRLLTHLRSRHPALDLFAETDSASVGFYRATGFTAISLGEKYPGVERFRVRLPAAPDQDSPWEPISQNRSTSNAAAEVDDRPPGA